MQSSFESESDHMSVTNKEVVFHVCAMPVMGESTQE